MGGRTSKTPAYPDNGLNRNRDVHAHRVKTNLYELHSRFYEQVVASDMREDFLRLEDKLEYGMKYNEWINTYYQGNPQKARNLLLAAVKMAEELEDEIMDCVDIQGVLEIGLSYSLSFYILISYILQYTHRGSLGQFENQFRVRLIEGDLQYKSMSARHKAKAIIAIFPSEAIIEPSEGLLLRLIEGMERDNLLGFRLPYHMLQEKEKEYYLLAELKK